MLKRIPKKRTNASRSQLVKNIRTGETAIYTPDARQPRIPAGWVPLNSGRSLNSSVSRWDWDEWDDYTKPAKLTPEMQNAVDEFYDGEPVTIEKVRKPVGAGAIFLRQRYDVKALIFVDFGDGDGEILGWDGSDVDNPTSFNLADLQDWEAERGLE